MVTAQPGSTERSDPAYRFDFCGGHLAADFVNTVGTRAQAAQRQEHLVTYGDLVAWAEARAVLSRDDVAGLRAWARQHPAAARGDLGRALELREALYNVLAAIARGRRPRPEDLDAVNRFVNRSVGTTLAMEHNRLVLRPPPATATDLILQPVVRAAVELLTSVDAERLGICADESCGWVFMDRTRSRTRRWCDMKVCGNRAKVRRFRDPQ